MSAFVRPGTLKEDNKYFCQQCDKKCDAHKVRDTVIKGAPSKLCVFICSQGFKFNHFPYVLTLHLKRFDFDYSTMQRIKLNDRWVWLILSCDLNP